MLRTLLNDSFLKHEIIEMKSKHKLKFGNGQPKAQARADANLLRLGRKLNLTTITRQYKDDDTVHKCVDFILSEKM